MGILSGIGSALDSGAVQSAVGVGSSAASSGGFWEGVTDVATGAFDWIGDNPEAANLIGGVATGAGQAYMANKQAKDQRAFDREMYERKRDDSRADRNVSPGEIEGYDSHAKNITNGLISNGMISGG